MCTQAVDAEDPALGFFVRWIEELAKKSEHVLVICLRKGIHSLPKNVEVISLGERHKIFRAFELCGIAWGRRNEYDAVFVHMNPEYIVAAGWLWRLRGKRVVLWYTHKSVNLRLQFAVVNANRILTASKESFRLPSRKVEIVGHGIDTNFFTPYPNIIRGDWVLSVGRLNRSKRHDLAIAGAAEANRRIKIVGGGPEKASLENKANELRVKAEFLGSLSQEQLLDEYRRASVLVHTSETGSLDKVVLEALATDLPVITTSDAYAGFPVQKVEASPGAIAYALQREPQKMERAAIVREKHSLSKLIPKIMQALRS